MALVENRGTAWRACCAALVLGALAGCGDQLPIFTGQGPSYSPAGTYDCCVSNVYYVCLTKLAYGSCLAMPPDPSQCTIQYGLDCPAGSNQ